MDNRSLAMHLVGIRTQVDALLMQLGVDTEQEDAGCAHPPAARQDLSVMNGPKRWQCRACGHIETEEEA